MNPIQSSSFFGLVLPKDDKAREELDRWEDKVTTWPSAAGAFINATLGGRFFDFKDRKLEELEDNCSGNLWTVCRRSKTGAGRFGVLDPLVEVEELSSSGLLKMDSSFPFGDGDLDEEGENSRESLPER